jgi:DNA-binding NtrC family response regulator
MTAPIASFEVTPQNPVMWECRAFLDLLVVDDDRIVREACREAAIALGYRAQASGSAAQALHMVESQNIDVILLDLKVSAAIQPGVLEQIKHHNPAVEIIIMACDGTPQSAVQAIKAGAFDYVAKPFGLHELKLALERVGTHLKLKVENRRLGETLKGSRGFGDMIGRAPEMDKLYRIIGKASHSSHPVLILGESGTGKEMVARAIHCSGSFHDKPFVPVDCGSLVPTLIESELFGYVKGAFTGAMQSKAGLLAIAEGGTVFLDEVGELPLELQAKLLRALQEKEIRPVGSTKQVPVNVRILAATNRDLENAVSQGLFRRDLYFRLNVLSLRIPALRERRQDIPLLAASFLERVSRASGRTHALSDDSMKALLAYDWPGNVRELENCIERCCAMNSGPVIHSLDLPGSITGMVTQLGHSAPGTRIVPIADLQRQAVLAAITQLNGDKLLAAKLLGIGKTTLYRKLKQYEEIQESSTMPTASACPCT